MKYVVIEGIIGAGKTTLTNQVAKALKVKPVLEEFAENPYLPEFYRDPQGKAFHLEMSFLNARRRQMLRALASKQQLIITDYHFQKTLLFARETLTKPEYSIFSEFYKLASSDIPEPDMVLFIDTAPDAALKNIRIRARDYETSISEDYLKKLYKSYRNLMKTVTPDRLQVISAVHAESPELPFTVPQVVSAIQAL